MSLSARIAPHLPYLRRFSRAVSGSQTSGDALVAATLEALIADTSVFPEASTDRIALFKLFTKLFGTFEIRVPEVKPTTAWEKRAAANLLALSPQPRQAFLLVAVEGFDPDEAAEIMDISSERISALLREASDEISRQVATDIMIIEDEPLIAMDIEELVESLGHRVVGTHAPGGHRSVREDSSEHGPGRYPARRRQLRHRRRQRNPDDHTGSRHLHHRFSRAPADRRAARAGVPSHEALQS